MSKALLYPLNVQGYCEQAAATCFFSPRVQGYRVTSLTKKTSRRTLQ